MTIEIQPGHEAPGVLAPARGGLIVVGVDAGPESLDAVEWAAVEAGARDAELRVVHVTPMRWLVNPFLPGAAVDVAELGVAEALVARAVARAREVAPEVLVSSRVLQGSPVSASNPDRDWRILAVIAT